MDYGVQTGLGRQAGNPGRSPLSGEDALSSQSSTLGLNVLRQQGWCETQSKFGLSKGPRYKARERMCNVRKLPHLRPSPPLQPLKPIREQVTCPPKQVMSHQARENRTPYPSSNTKTVHPFPRAASRRACPPPRHAASTACLPAGAEDEVNAPVKRVHLIIRRVSMPANLFFSRLPFFSCGLVQDVTFFPLRSFLFVQAHPVFWQANI